MIKSTIGAVILSILCSLYFCLSGSLGAIIAISIMGGFILYELKKINKNLTDKNN